MSGSTAIAYAPPTEGQRTELLALLRSCSLPTDDLPADLSHFVVATAAGRLVGSAGVELLGDAALFRSLAVAPEFRGRGVAWHLFTCVRRQLGAQHLFLLTTTAEGLFARWGFKRISRAEAHPSVQGTAEFRTLCPSSAVVMRYEAGSATALR